MSLSNLVGLGKCRFDLDTFTTICQHSGEAVCPVGKNFINIPGDCIKFDPCKNKESAHLNPECGMRICPPVTVPKP